MDREKPIIFCPEKVKAILEGRMTQFRQVIICNDMRPLGPHGCMWPFRRGKDIPDMPGVPEWLPVYPRYQVGDELWCKEPHYLYGAWFKNGTTKTGRQKWRFTYAKSMGVKFPDAPPKNIHTKKEEVGWYKRPGRFMPKRGARLWLRVTAVKDPHQVQNISEEDAKAEGLTTTDLRWNESLNIYIPETTACENFQKLWNRLHPKPGERFEDGPWVFPTVVERIQR